MSPIKKKQKKIQESNAIDLTSDSFEETKECTFNQWETMSPRTKLQEGIKASKDFFSDADMHQAFALQQEYDQKKNTQAIKSHQGKTHTSMDSITLSSHDTIFVETGFFSETEMEHACALQEQYDQKKMTQGTKRHQGKPNTVMESIRSSSQHTIQFETVKCRETVKEGNRDKWTELEKSILTAANPTQEETNKILEGLNWRFQERKKKPLYVPLMVQMEKFRNEQSINSIYMKNNPSLSSPQFHLKGGTGRGIGGGRVYPPPLHLARDPFDLSYDGWLRDIFYHIPPRHIQFLTTPPAQLSFYQVELLATGLHFLYDSQEIQKCLVQYPGGKTQVDKVNKAVDKVLLLGVTYKVVHSCEDARPSSSKMGIWEHYPDPGMKGLAEKVLNYILTRHKHYCDMGSMPYTVNGLLQEDLYHSINHQHQKCVDFGIFQAEKCVGTTIQKGIDIRHYRSIFFLFDIRPKANSKKRVEFFQVDDIWQLWINKGDDRWYTTEKEYNDARIQAGRNFATW